MITTSALQKITFITKVLFIDWLQKVFLPTLSHLGEQTKYQGKMVLILDGHVTSRFFSYAESQGLLLIRLVPHPSHLVQLLDLCVFGLFKTIYYKERKSKSIQGETRKMYRDLLAFDKATIILMVRWSFERVGFLLDLENIRNTVQIVPSRVLDRIGLPDSEIDDSFTYPGHMRKDAEAMDAARKCTPTPKPSEFAISLAAYIQTKTVTCPLCGYEEEDQVSNEKESDSNETDLIHITFRLAFMTLSIADPEVYA
jgi:hypothetical protein